jgi:hypothetical protein
LTPSPKTPNPSSPALKKCFEQATAPPPVDPRAVA